MIFQIFRLIRQSHCSVQVPPFQLILVVFCSFHTVIVTWLNYNNTSSITTYKCVCAYTPTCVYVHIYWNKNLKYNMVQNTSNIRVQTKFWGRSQYLFQMNKKKITWKWYWTTIIQLTWNKLYSTLLLDLKFQMMTSPYLPCTHKNKGYKHCSIQTFNIQGF